MARSEPVNILIVDDLPEKVLVLETILAELGERVVVARSGEEALRQVLKNDFAVILLDVNMPGMDGLETAAYLRRRKSSAHTPLIFITAYADEMLAAQGYSLGAVDYVLAPIVPEVLRTKVKVFVDLFRMTRQVREQADERVALAREQAARTAAEEMNRRLAFLAEASTVLSSSLELDVTMRGLARLAVPLLADLSIVLYTAEPGKEAPAEMAWVGRKGGITSRSLPARSVLPPAMESALQQAHGSRTPVTISGLGLWPLEWDSGVNGEIQHLALESGLVLPLRARKHTVGVLALLSLEKDVGPDRDDISLIEDLASRAAVALDNARLYRGIQEADARKNQFLAMLAHELRNPLAPIKSAVQVLRMKPPKEPIQVEARDMIERQVTHMARLIDDLLDMSGLARGKVLLRREHLDLVELVRATTNDYLPMLAANGAKLEVNLPAERLGMFGDPTRLAQVVGNVLHNASKFTDPGGVVSVEVQRDGDAALVVIRDTGIGMEPEMLARVFETFSQADTSLDRSRGGLGLGLALVKGLVDLHGGKVWAQSEGLGKGTEVTIRLPLAEAPAAVDEAEAPPAPARTQRVLIIEDNRDAAESMRILFKLGGHQVEVAHTGPKGLEVARRFDPEVVLCDIGLAGGMDGYAVAQALRRQQKLNWLIALSGYGQRQDQERSLEAGFDVHLTKPVDFNELQQMLTTVPGR
jgi:signal transduction histidine kinase/DNA-binding response OmpR family regulator